MCVELKPILPEVTLLLGIFAGMILSVSRKGSSIKSFSLLVMTIVVALKAMQFCSCHGFGEAFGGAVKTSMPGTIFGGLIYLFTAISLFALKSDQGRISEKILLILFTALGAGALLISGNMVTWYISLEIMSLSVYALTASDYKNSFSAEAAIKYFMQGAFISVIILFGLALIYGLTGSLSFPMFALPSTAGGIQMIALGLILCGMGFKIGLVPFHYWAADVYQSVSGGLSAFLASVVKVAAAGATFIILVLSAPQFGDETAKLIWIFSVSSMLAGNLLALFQHNLKRMLAYSAIAHSGYFVISFYSPLSAASQSAFVFYLLIYVITTVITFTFADALESRKAERPDAHSIEGLKGLGRKHPLVCMAFSFGLLSLAGLPPAFAGLFGKIFILLAAFNDHNIGLAVVLIISAAISCYYYLKPIAYLFYSEEPESNLNLGLQQKIVILALTFVLILISLCPLLVLDFLPGF